MSAPRPETTRELARRTVDPNDRYSPGPIAAHRIAEWGVRNHKTVLTLGGVLVTTLLAAGGWLYRQELLARTVERQGEAIERLEDGVQRGSRNTAAICKALGVDCEAP